MYILVIYVCVYFLCLVWFCLVMISFLCLLGLSQPHSVASSFLQHNCFDSSTVISLGCSLFSDQRSVYTSWFIQSRIRSVRCALILAGAWVASATTCWFQCFPVAAPLEFCCHTWRSTTFHRKKKSYSPTSCWCLGPSHYFMMTTEAFLHLFCVFLPYIWSIWCHKVWLYPCICILFWTYNTTTIILFIFFIDSMLVLKWPSIASTACFQ